MANSNLRIWYRIIIVFVIIISIQYFYFNPLHKIAGIIPSQIKKSDHPLASLFFFKTANQRDSARDQDLDIVLNNNNNNYDNLVTKPAVSNRQIHTAVTPTNINTNVSSLTVLQHSTNNKTSATTLNSTVGATMLKAINNNNNNTNSNTTTSVSNNSKNDQEFCPVPPPTLIGFFQVSLAAPTTLQSISRMHPDLELGGHYKPSTCESKDKVAIIVPFRDREEHLRIFLYNIHPVLKRQMIEYNIYVIEQAGAEPFNRAMLFNVGFLEALKRFNYTCFIFHDVDLIPENDHNLYNCPTQPRHMSVAIDKMKYQLPYKTLFGGISALRTEHFKLVNGFSNVFWGWGAEDDDMANRIAFRGLYISRPSPDVARYKMLKHKPQKLNNNRYRMLLKGKQRFNIDGINSVKYTVDQIVLEKLYTLIRVILDHKGDG